LVRIRNRRRRLRATELHRGADGGVVHAPARAVPDGRRPAGRHAAHLPGVAARDGAAVRDAVEARADRQARIDAVEEAEKQGVEEPCPRCRLTRPGSTWRAPTWCSWR